MRRSPLAHALLLPISLLTLATPQTRADVLDAFQTGLAVSDLGSPSTFGFFFARPLIGISGPVQVTTHVIGVFADGGRDGASFSLPAPTLVGGTLTTVDNIPHDVSGAGGPASFAGAGGVAGIVTIGAGVVTDFGAPSHFTFSFTTPTAGAGTLTTSQSHLGAVLMDFSGDGATATGSTPLGKLAAFQADGVTHTELGSTFSAVGLAGSELDAGTASIADPLVNSEIRLDFALGGGGDTAALIGRQEIGGDVLAGSVMQIYPLVSQSEVIDCGPGGCDTADVSLQFTGSGGGDFYAFIIRQEISAVPETNGMALVGFGLFGLVTTWWRVRRSRSVPTHQLNVS